MNTMNRYRQQGAVLIVSLLILLVISILAVTSVSTTSMEEKMASNTRQERIAFEAAEAALRTAEGWLFANLANRTQIRGNFNGSVVGLYSEISAPESSRAPLTWDVYADSNWSGANSVAVTTISMFPGTPGAPGSNRPRYTIEYIGRVGDPPLNYYDPDLRQFAFRITAMAWGLDTTAHYLLQSTVRMPL